MDDGVDEPTGKGTSRVAPGYSTNGIGFAGSSAESAMLNSLLGPTLGVSARRRP